MALVEMGDGLVYSSSDLPITDGEKCCDIVFNVIIVPCDADVEAV